MAEQMTFEEAKDILYASLSQMFNMNDPAEQAWVDEFYSIAGPMITNGMDVNRITDQVLLSPTPPAKFAQRFKGILDLQKKRDSGKDILVPTIAEYVTGENEYKDLAIRMGMKNIGSRENYAKLVGEAEVSLREITERIDDATAAVKNLDANVREQLKTEFPSLTDSAMAEAILVPGGIGDLEKKIARSEINVEAQQAGLTSALGAEALRTAGVTRADARKGFQTTKDYLAQSGQAIQETAKQFGEGLTTQELQTELEKETMLGQTSTKRKRLASQQRAQFGGQSGVVAGSLSKKKQV